MTSEPHMSDNGRWWIGNYGDPFEELHLDAEAVARVRRKMNGFMECVERGEKPDAPEWQKIDAAQYALGWQMMKWILDGASE